MISYGFLTSHVYKIQVQRHESLYHKAKSKYTASRTWSGKRGHIFDRHGNPLVGNLECKDIRADLTRMPKNEHKRHRIIQTLSRILDVDMTVLERRFASKASEVVVKNRVDIELAAKVEELRIPGIRFIDKQRRFYPKSKLLANVLGFTDLNNHGVYGVEKRWDTELSPKPVKQIYERDRKGRAIRHHSPTLTAAVDGDDIYLTIDEPIQHFVEVELQAMVDKFAPQKAYAIMADPATGSVLAMAQYPTFDPNDRGDITPDQWRNHIASDVYDPGSTMKCISIAGALDYGVVTPGTVVDCENGQWIYWKRPLRDAGHAFGDLKVFEIVQKSSNIGTAKIALALGKPRLYQIFRRFGFGETTGLGLSNESRGILRKPKDWDGLSITRFPIGQGISVTPLQMVQAYCAIANKGRMMQLYLTDRTIDSVSGAIKLTKPSVKRFVVREKAANQITSAMTLVTKEGGTATKAAVSGYDVAGKTGTSQKLVNGSYTGHGKYIASFIGFVPADNPAFVLLVIADEPSKKSHYGGTVAGPTFRRIADRTLRYLNVPPTSTTTLSSHENTPGRMARN